MKTSLTLAAATAISLVLAAGAQAQTSQDGALQATLDNGLRVIVVRDPLAPVVTTEVNYLVGSDEAPAGFPGTAHALEHMMFRGGPGLSKDQLAAIGANMGGAFNADTTSSVTQYYFVAPTQDLEVALHTEALRMTAIDLSQAEWQHERGAIEQEVSRDLSSPDYKFLTQLQAQLFAGTPYEHTALGTRDSFDKTDATLLRSFHDAWYAPNNAILLIVGDLDPAAALALAKREFGSIPRRTLPARPTFSFASPKAETIELTTDNPYGEVYLAYRWPGLRSSSYATALILEDALGSQRSALFGMGMEGTALYGGFAAQSFPEAGLGFAIGIFARGGDPKPVLARMQAIMAQAAEKGIDPALIEAAKKKAIATLEFQKNSVVGLTNAWAEAVAFQGAASPDAIKADLEAVTPQAVNALAKSVFNPSEAVTAILTPESSGAPVGGSGFGGAETFAANPDKPVILPSWAAGAFAKLEAPTATLHPVSYTLANGLRVIVQPESVSDTIEVFGRIRTNEDLEAPKGQDGVAEVLDGLFPFGTTSLDRLQFQQALDAISASESAGTNFSLSVPAANFAAGLKLLADNELHPALPAAAFPVAKGQVGGLVAGLVRSPAFLTEIGRQQALLPKDDLELRHPTPETVAGLDLDGVKRYYAQVYRPDMTTIVVVGKIDPATARDLVEQAFGGWRAEGPKPEVDYVAVPANAASRLVVPDASAVQDTVDLAEMVDVTRDSPDRFALALGNEILGGGFYASWFSRDLREDNGLVYTVSTRFDLKKHRGDYSVSFGSDPDKVAPAAALIVRDLKRIQTAPVSEGDLTWSKGVLLRQIPLAEASFNQIARELLTYAEEDKPLDENIIAGRHYLTLTASDIQQAFRAHVRPDGFVTTVKGPAPKP